MATIAEVAKFCNISPRRVQQLVQEGMPKGAKRGEYSVAACGHWYIKHLQTLQQAKVDPQTRPDAMQFTRDKSRLARAQAEVVELRVAAQKGDLVPLSVIAQEFGKNVTTTKTLILGLPAKLAPVVHALETEAEVYACIQQACHEALDVLAAWRPEAPKSRDARR